MQLNTLTSLVYSLLLACLPLAALGQEAPVVTAQEAKVDPYTGNVELGYVKTSGNTQAQTLNAKAKVEAKYAQWRQTLKLEALNTADRETTTAERYLAYLKSDYEFSQKDYAFGLLNYENDRFSGYDYHMSIVLGYGRRLLNTPTLLLELEGGPGYRYSELNDGSKQDEAVFRLAGDFKWQLSKSATFEEELSTEIGEDATISRSVTSLSSQIVGSLAMKLAYSFRYTSEVPVGVEKRDTATSVTLVYKF